VRWRPRRARVSRHVSGLVEPTLFPKAKSWYMGANIPGKPLQSLNYPGGLPLYRQKFAEVKENDFAGFTISCPRWRRAGREGPPD
jgi:hypothetical protein